MIAGVTNVLITRDTFREPKDNNVTLSMAQLPIYFSFFGDTKLSTVPTVVIGL